MEMNRGFIGSWFRRTERSRVQRHSPHSIWCRSFCSTIAWQRVSRGETEQTFLLSLSSGCKFINTTTAPSTPAPAQRSHLWLHMNLEYTFPASDFFRDTFKLFNEFLFVPMNYVGFIRGVIWFSCGFHLVFEKKINLSLESYILKVRSFWLLPQLVGSKAHF